MNNQICVRDLYQENCKRLDLKWVAGQQGAQRCFSKRSTTSGSPALVGYFNLIHPNQAQVLGKTELDYIQQLGQDSFQEACKKLFEDKSIVILVTDDQKPPPQFIELAEQYKLPLIRTRLTSYEVLTNLRYYLTHKLANRLILHGVFLEVLSMGVLLTGESGTGKSELALELISRGHRLIADDAPEFARIAPDIINGNCPSLLQDFLEVRGLGVLNIRAMYGDSVIQNSKYLGLIIHLISAQNDTRSIQDRLQINQQVQHILGLDIPVITIPVAPGRNLAVLVEAAVRNHLLRLNGYDAGEDLSARQQRIMR
jgi:HPr kinase/phosphorylase